MLVKLQNTESVTNTQAIALLTELESMQLIFTRVMESPAGKIMDCLIQLSGQIYSRCNEALLETDVKQVFESVLGNEIKILQKQQSKAVFNPVLS